MRQLKGTQVYKPHKLERVFLNSDVEFHDPQCRQKQAELIVQLVTAEGPIHIELVAKRLAEAWSLGRVGARMRKAVGEACHICERYGAVRKTGDFLWPARFDEIVIRKSDPSSSTPARDTEYIPTEELSAAMKLIIRDAVGISPESLMLETGRLFGFSRNGEKIQRRVTECLGQLLQRNEVIQTGESITIKNGN